MTNTLTLSPLNPDSCHILSIFSLSQCLKLKTNLICKFQASGALVLITLIRNLQNWITESHGCIRTETVEWLFHINGHQCSSHWWTKDNCRDFVINHFSTEIIIILLVNQRMTQWWKNSNNSLYIVSVRSDFRFSLASSLKTK